MTSATTTAVRGLRAAWLAVIGVAWAAAIAVHASGAVRSGDHAHVFAAGPPALSLAAAFLAVWVVHVAAVMLPTSLPLLRLFARVAAGQDHAARAVAALVGGYLTVWAVAGLLALSADGVLHMLVNLAGLSRPGVLTGAALLLAAGFQFTGLKERCLRACRAPATLLRRWYGRGLWVAARLGLRHGLHCLGCCWALMLVMFAVGFANLAWMAPLALLMAAERSAGWGQRIVRPAGVTLAAVGLLFAVGAVTGVGGFGT